MTRRPTRTRDRGSAVLEFIAFAPVVLLVGTLALQAGAAVWATSSTTEAAREAARQYSLTDDPAAARAAAVGSLPGSLKVAAMTTLAPHGVELVVDVPRVSVLPTISITRRAVLP